MVYGDISIYKIQTECEKLKNVKNKKVDPRKATNIKDDDIVNKEKCEVVSKYLTQIPTPPPPF